MEHQAKRKNINDKFKFTYIIFTLSLVLLFILIFRDYRETKVAYDFYHQHYFSRIEGYNEEALVEHFKTLENDSITISVENLKAMDPEYQKALFHRRRGYLVIKPLSPYEGKKIKHYYKR